MKKVLLFITLISFSITQSQIVNIPDINFKNTLLNANSSNFIAKDFNGDYTNIDINNDGEIQVIEAHNISALHVYNKNISDLAGIEEFINLTLLQCNENQLTTLDVSDNINLIRLICNNNQIITLDLNDNINLTRLECSENQLTTLVGVNNNINLTQLNCYHNQLIALDVSNNINLTTLDCRHNLLTSLDVSDNINLTDISCYLNQLTTLNVSSNTNLISFGCGGNQLTTLDVSNNTNLISFDCVENQLTALDISNNINLTNISCYNNQLTTLDVSNNINLTDLDCGHNQLTTLDVSSNSNLRSLYCYENSLNTLDVSNNTNLYDLHCNNNQLNTLNISENINLVNIFCNHNQLTTLDVNENINLTTLQCSDNIDLEYINLKNGNNHNFNIVGGYYSSHFVNLPNLQAVCVDELNTGLTNFITTETYHSIDFTDYCESSQTNTINGTVNIDIDNNGCDFNDISMQNILIIATNGTESFESFVLENSSYAIFTTEGDFTTSIANLPSYFTANPSSQTNTFIDLDNSFTADFCVTSNQTVNDVNISTIPTSQARPGFETTYKIVYKNMGTTQLNGNITLEFDETKLSFSNASETISSQTSNSLTFDYSNLNPFETRTIDLEFNVFAPPTVNIGDELEFNASINPIIGDETEDDNIFILDQTVIGSYDPNDITCLEGNQILLADVDKYLHYVIRFQNTGTAHAVKVVVENLLDEKLDWTTLQLESISHNNRVEIKNGNEISFIFDAIYLPDSTTDEPNSHGFIAYKIKPKVDIALGDVIPNKADIFFDYNTAIETNIATTTIVNTLAVNDSPLLDFSIYPIPTDNILNINSKTKISKIEIYSKLGQLILKNETENNIDISNLTNGLYFVKAEDINGNFGVKKIMKK